MRKGIFKTVDDAGSQSQRAALTIDLSQSIHHAHRLRQIKRFAFLNLVLAGRLEDRETSHTQDFLK